MSLTQLIYCSRKNTDLRPEAIFGIRDQARANNARQDLTGVLLFNRDCFMQCLEGDREQVTETFAAISQDARHDHVALVAVQDIPQRSFPDWTMGLLDANSPSLRAALDDILPSTEFTPETLPADTAVTVMNRMRTLHFAY
ncbi:BLUF domain-containing protein [Winogradskya humida]|uniref:BLUF domain-containing protein n=1 Tax=Winogradskya humida TaxID=113566 RepID=A0ABQ3ZJZ0_9ACTN|nr:BLUF domain-containing protein [Actinoplanes humidus]GIE18872.1 hypothetical protein Ahu01nite_019740 [Actinoplanes humidus]